MDDIQKAKEILSSKSSNIILKTRALFILRNDLNEDSSIFIANLLKNEEDKGAILLKHEMAYILGQMRNPKTQQQLIDILLNEKQDCITRHEAAEALGNFVFCKEIQKALEKMSYSQEKMISESCYLALKKLKEENVEVSPFGSHDPAIAGDSYNEIFLDNNACLYERYKIMFYLRNLNNKFAIEKLAEGFICESVLFKHEIAFVFGQMKNEDSIDVLEKVVRDEKEDSVVRHEALEALGSIGTERCLSILEVFKKHEIRIIRESALVGLDIPSEDYFKL